MSRRIKRSALHSEMIESRSKAWNNHRAAADGEIPNTIDALADYETFYSDRAEMIGRILNGEGLYPDKETPDLKALHEMLDEQGGYSYYPNGAQGVLQSLIYTPEYVTVSQKSDVPEYYDIHMKCKEISGMIERRTEPFHRYERERLQGRLNVFQAVSNDEYDLNNDMGSLDRRKLQLALEEVTEECNQYDTILQNMINLQRDPEEPYNRFMEEHKDRPPGTLFGEQNALEELLDGKHCKLERDESHAEWDSETGEYLIYVPEDRFVESLPYLEGYFTNLPDGSTIAFQLYPEHGDSIFALATLDQSQQKGSKISNLIFDESGREHFHQMDLGDALDDLSEEDGLQQ